MFRHTDQPGALFSYAVLLALFMHFVSYTQIGCANCIENPLPKLIKLAAPAVVSVYSKRAPVHRDPMEELFFGHFFGSRESGSTSLGSGIIISEDGLMVTNHHVIAKGGDINVVMHDGTEMVAKLVVSDDKIDLALLKIEADNLPILQLGDSDVVEVGDPVLAIGNPFGLGNTVTHGIVSATSRSASSVSDYSFFIQTDAAVNFGNSGGPLLDRNGQVIGVNTAIYSNNGSGFIGIGFAIPSNVLKNFLKSVKTDSDTGSAKIVRPWIGASFQSMTQGMRDSLGVTHGAIVSKVYDDSPFANTGIRAGDVVMMIGEHKVNSAGDIKRYLWGKSIGNKVSIKVMSGGLEKERTMLLIAPPASGVSTVEGYGAYTVQDTRSPFFGLVFNNISPALIEEMDLVGDIDRGVAVVSSSATQRTFRLSLKPGDVLRSINNEQIRDVEDLRAFLEANVMLRVWDLVIDRHGQRMRMRLAG